MTPINIFVDLVVVRLIFASSAALFVYFALQKIRRRPGKKFFWLALGLLVLGIVVYTANAWLTPVYGPPPSPVVPLGPSVS